MKKLEIEQCKKTIEELRNRIAELEKESSWIAATGERRLILNLEGLSSNMKAELKGAIDSKYTWISIRKDGELGSYSNNCNGLTFYLETEVIL